MRGSAAAYLGRFDEALLALQRAVALSADSAVPAARAKSRLALAGLWLTLGQPDAARELLQDLPADIGPGMQMQTQWLLARAALADGLSPRRPWQALAHLAAAHARLPLVQSAWYEVSFQGDAQELVVHLARVRAECLEQGLVGTARSLHLRELARRLELQGPEAVVQAADAARALLPHVATGMSAKVYPPQAWRILAQAFERADEVTQALACLQQARAWVQQASQTVPAGYLQSYLSINPDNRALGSTS